MSVRTKEHKRERPDNPSFPDAVVEARGCLRLARKTGEIAVMRAMIQIAPNEERALRRMSECGELAEVLVWRAVEFRKAVLAEFDRLLAASETAASSRVVGSRMDEGNSQRDRPDTACAAAVDARDTSRTLTVGAQQTA